MSYTPAIVHSRVHGETNVMINGKKFVDHSYDKAEAHANKLLDEYRKNKQKKL